MLSRTIHELLLNQELYFEMMILIMTIMMLMLKVDLKLTVQIGQDNYVNYKSVIG